LKVKPNSEKTFGNVQKVAEEERVIENGNVIEKAESIFQQCTENYQPCKRCSM
jgi:hypothetical protein